MEEMNGHIAFNLDDVEDQRLLADRLDTKELEDRSVEEQSPT